MGYIASFILGCMCGVVLGGIVVIAALAAGMHKKGIKL